jgi:hypothetical protein
VENLFNKKTTFNARINETCKRKKIILQVYLPEKILQLALPAPKAREW